MGENEKKMTDKDFREQVFRVYERLVYEEHDANKRPRCFEKDITREWVSGYQDGIGKALDLLGPVLGLGVKWSEDGKLILPGGENDT